MKERFRGLIILLLVIALAGGYMYFRGSKPRQVALTGLLGGEKIGLFESEEFKDYIQKQYGLTMDYRKAGSFDMVKGSLDGQDYLFPASQLASELFIKEGHRAQSDDIVFNTPIVLYSRKAVVDALKKKRHRHRARVRPLRQHGKARQAYRRRHHLGRCGLASTLRQRPRGHHRPE